MSAITFRQLSPADLPMLHEWLTRLHVAEWWQPTPSFSDVQEEFTPLTYHDASTRGYIALLDDAPLGFIQSYVVLGSGDGWWEDETDPGARGIDQFLADPDRLNQGLGRAMIRTFVDGLFLDPSVTRVQTDPSPANFRAIRCYERAGFTALREVITPDGPALLMMRERNA
jgi:RimJ/RimL family protein N-acetyltransferase